jgi:hypothetical protein
MFKERSEIEQKFSPRDMTDDELRERLFQNLRALGATEDVARIAAGLSQTGETDRVKACNDTDGDAADD